MTPKPRYSVVIPTLNEEARIGACLEAAKLALGEDAERIVVDGGSDDRTREIASRRGARVLTTPAGRGTQLRSGAREARGRTVVLLHADTLLPPGADAEIAHALSDAGVVGGAFRIRFGSDAEQGVVLRIWAHAMNVRSRVFRTATGDQAIFVRRTMLESIGGIPPVPLFEDVRLMRKLRRAGQIRILPARVTTSPRLWSSTGALRVLLLHLRLRLLHAAGASPQRLAAIYRRKSG